MYEQLHLGFRIITYASSEALVPVALHSCVVLTL